MNFKVALSKCILFSLTRYEIREDRRRENLRSDENFDRLRSDVISALTGNASGTENERLKSSNSGVKRPLYNRLSAQYQDHSSYPEYHTQGTGVYKTSFSDHVTPLKPETLSKMSEMAERSSFYTAAKVESYLNHLEDDISTSTSVSYPLPNITNDPFRSHSGVFEVPIVTSYGHRLYSSSNNDTKDSAYRNTTSESVGRQPNHSQNRLISDADLEAIKLDIVTSLKTELQDAAREMARELLQPTNSTGNIPELSSDLYQTHLYTQL